MAKKTKYHFNKETLSYEKIEVTFLKVLRDIGIYTFVGIVIGVATFFAASKLFSSPMEKSLKKENEELKSRYKLIENGVIRDLHLRDNNLYRVIFQADPIEINPDSSLRYYDKLSHMSNANLMDYISMKTNHLAKSIYVQSKSYDELVLLAKQNENRLQNLPAIQPVMNKDLRRLASGYGYRIDPIYHVKRYGMCVIINHGSNYETLYAHQSKILVRQGQSVKRGEVIGLVGNTGKSTAPHLHYEVRLKGQPQDPRNYYLLDLTPEQYDEMIRLSESSGNVLD